jgi:nitroreductase
MKILKLFVVIACMMSIVACCNQKEESKNETIETIMARRSIRKYKPDSVERGKLKVNIEWGINAPNGQNKQSWEVRVVDNPEVMDYIKRVMIEAYDEKVVGCFSGAPVMVFIARDVNYDFSAYDCGLLAGNILLSAQSLGVGSIVLGSPVRFINDAENSAEILHILGYSENYELCLCVGLGYAAEAPDAKPRDINKVQFVD